MSSITHVAASEWESWVHENDAIILDVREADEWQLGILPDAMQMSQGEVIDRLDELPKDRAVLCVCRTGGRSSNVAVFLSFNGYQAANLSGGMKALGLQP